MALEDQREDAIDRGDATNELLNEAYGLVVRAQSKLDYALRGISDQTQRTLTSTAYDVARQTRVLTRQTMLLRGTQPKN